jgi:hypothetical protein
MNCHGNDNFGFQKTENPYHESRLDDSTRLYIECHLPVQALIERQTWIIEILTMKTMKCLHEDVITNSGLNLCSILATL